MSLLPIRLFKSIAAKVPARVQICFGLTFLLLGVLLFAVTLGWIPDDQKVTAAARARFCEAVAVHCSALMTKDEAGKLRSSFAAMVQRDPDVVYAAVRRSDGKLVAHIRPPNAPRRRPAALTGPIVSVPIWSHNKICGNLEIRFRATRASGLRGYAQTPQVRLVVFVTCGCMLLFMLYLRKMLQHLDPSQVVPTRVRSALDTLAEGLLVIDNSERIVLANEAFATIIGTTPDRLLGSRASKLSWIREGDLAAQPFPWVEAIRTGSPQRDVRARLTDHASVVRTFSVNCSPIFGDGGKPRGVLSSFDDVTRLEQKEAELRKSKEAAESASRAKSDFVARMSHEIRTPMNAILGFAEALRRGYEGSDAERREFLETIHASGTHLLDLINDILDLSKIEAGKLEVEPCRCSPNQIICDVVAILSDRARQKGIQLISRWDGPAPQTILTDPTRLRQALTNLAGNAIKFTETGSVELVARLDQSGKAPMLSVDVIDSGIGMSAEALGRIFQPFTQADASITRRFGGTGLGLSISRQIAAALGGEITVRSEIGKGSTFTVSIATGPLEGVIIGEPAADAAGAAEPADAITTEKVLTGVRVLLVDDGESNRKLASLVLRRAGATVECAVDGDAGARMALGQSFNVILMDMQMAVMDGYEATALLRGKGIAVPILAMTAHAMRGDEDKCRAAGCSGFISKPIDMDALVRTVAEATGSRAAMPTDAGHETIPDAACDPLAEAASDPLPEPESAAPQDGLLHSTLPTEDPEFCEIVEMFVDRLHEQLNAIEKASAEGDMAELAALAHWVKGSGGTAGFTALTEPAQELERAARERRLAEIAAAVAELHDLASRIAVPTAEAPLPANEL